MSHLDPFRRTITAAIGLVLYCDLIAVLSYSLRAVKHWVIIGPGQGPMSIVLGGRTGKTAAA